MESFHGSTLLAKDIGIVDGEHVERSLANSIYQVSYAVLVALFGLTVKLHGIPVLVNTTRTLVI